MSPADRISKIEKVREMHYHPWAVCITAGCPWEIGAGGKSRQFAKDHATVQGHHVQIVQETHAHWAPEGYDFKTQDKTDEELAALGNGR